MSKRVMYKSVIALALATMVGTVSTMGVFAETTSVLPDFSSEKKGSLTIHKYSSDSIEEWGTATGSTADEENLPDDATPLAGIEFTLFKYGDTSMVGQEIPEYSADNLTGSVGSWKYKVSDLLTVDGDSRKTDASGLIEYKDLDLGRYLVVETDAPESVTDRTDPFFVDIPMTDPVNRDNWVYDVTVYPKNVVDYDIPTVGKDITKPDNKHETATIGEELTWIINSKNPKTINDYTKYIVTDTLDEKLALVDNSLNVKWGTDYNTAVVVDAKNYVNSSEGQNIKISFTTDYLKTVKRSDEENTYYFYVEYKTKLLGAKYDEDGNALGITNDAQIEYDYTNKPADDTGFTTIPDDVVPEVHVGGLKFKKVDASTSNALAGAEFKIATSEENARNGEFVKGIDGNDLIAVSGADGIVDFDGLSYGTTGQTATEGSTEYWVVETKAPAGYQLLTSPKSFTVNYQSHSDAHALGTSLPNNKESELPKTGSDATLIYVFSGIMILAMGVVMTFRKQRISK